MSVENGEKQINALTNFKKKAQVRRRRSRIKMGEIGVSPRTKKLLEDNQKILEYYKKSGYPISPPKDKKIQTKKLLALEERTPEHQLLFKTEYNGSKERTRSIWLGKFLNRVFSLFIRLVKRKVESVPETSPLQKLEEIAYHSSEKMIFVENNSPFSPGTTADKQQERLNKILNATKEELDYADKHWHRSLFSISFTRKLFEDIREIKSRPDDIVYTYLLNQHEDTFYNILETLKESKETLGHIDEDLIRLSQEILETFSGEINARKQELDKIKDDQDLASLKSLKGRLLFEKELQERHLILQNKNEEKIS